MDVTVLLTLFGAGCLSGFLAGYFGVGGGVVLVPILMYFFSEMGVSGLVATHVSLGTSLLIVFITSISAGYRHHKNGNVIRRAAVIVGLSSVLAALSGSWLAASLSGRTLQQLFALVLVVAAIRLLVESGTDKEKRQMADHAGGYAVTGISAGLVSSLSGVGGGIVAVPLLCRLMHFPIRKAVGTSSATIVLTAFAGTIGYALNGIGNPDLAGYPFTLGFVDCLHSLPVIAGAVPLAGIGANTASRTPNERLRKFFAVFLLVVSAKTFFF